MTTERPTRKPSVGLTLFVCLFAGQAALIAVSPVLPEVASDFGVSIATAGQLRSVSGLAAGLVALALGAAAARLGLRDLLLLGLGVLAAGSLLSSAAPSFGVLVAAQVAVGGGLALVLSGGLAAAAAWTTDERRAPVLSWALVGQPGAWIVGMPVVGLLGGVSWRLGWLVVPFAASVVALVAVGRRPAEVASEEGRGTWLLLRRNPKVAGWALGELLAFSAWAGTLVFAGALLVESYSASPGAAGVLLGLAAVAYLPGNFIARRWIGEWSRVLLILLPLVAAVLAALLGSYRPSLWVSAVVLSVLAFISAGRTIAGSALGLELCSMRRIFAMRIRAAAAQFGYLLGAVLGGLALARWGYAGMGATFGVLFLLAAIPHAAAWAAGRRLAQPIPKAAQGRRSEIGH